MRTISLKIDDKIITEMDRIRIETKKSRSQYIREALGHFNKLQKRSLIAKQLSLESNRVRKHSLEILREFEMQSELN